MAGLAQISQGTKKSSKCLLRVRNYLLSLIIQPAFTERSYCFLLEAICYLHLSKRWYKTPNRAQACTSSSKQVSRPGKWKVAAPWVAYIN